MAVLEVLTGRFVPCGVVAEVIDQPDTLHQAFYGLFWYSQ